MELEKRTIAILRMSLVRGLGLRSSNALIRQFKTPEAVLDAGRPQLEAAGIPPEVADDLMSPKSQERAEQEWAKAGSLGIRILDILHPDYPPLLREIFDPPVILYIKGSGWNPDLPQVAIVGTRRPTGYGLNCAERIAEDLATRGLTITSGLARGVDSAAHRGALRGGATFAVFGCGLDTIYPKENRKLAEMVEEKGALLAEFPLGTPPSPENFPIRNRIIAGMSLGVIVVEAAEYSGSLITARLAVDSNREVFAIPGNITSPNSFGPHVLIRQGARLVASWQDWRVCRKKSGDCFRSSKPLESMVCWQSCRPTRPKSIVRCLNWRRQISSVNCPEKSSFGDSEKIAVLIFIAERLI
jgi:DNA processing protein